MTFKLILTGITGRIGGEVLQQSLKNPSVTSVIALARRPVPELASHPKLDLVVVKDFKQYPDELIAQLSGADGCIWYSFLSDQNARDADAGKVHDNASR